MRILLGLALLYFISLVFLYFKQERFFFNPKLLDKAYAFQFKQPFEELNIEVEDNVSLNAVLFKTHNPKGVILYLHGNAGAIHDWGKRAPLYLGNGYDILFVDYRGYGKSDGEYTNSSQLFNDAQKVYDFTKTRYPEDNIVVLGFSLGTGLAAYLAANNHPKMLILNAPYYSWQTLITEEIAPPVPKFLLKYDIPTFEFIKDITCPVKIFHGTKDFLIRAETNSEKLQQINPNNIELTLIQDASHNSIHISKQYYDALKRTLEN
ncbi:alpha/beta hydrolase [Mangrovimonas sp. TPBH4]|uniref:alpha/beta hydrolase n=1 Tax=Mangrovimonas sp. TPBH4 TaxID=1645914 RepID=UPI000AF76B50|nr:alpha/beta fold hydrolase [Mangrovimonas sp. TPBH4]